MNLTVRDYAPSDRAAVIALSLRAWEPVFASVRAALRGSGVYELHYPDGWSETGDDPGHAPARTTYAQAGFRLLPVARYFKAL